MDFPLGHRLSELPGPLLLTGHTGFKGTWMTFLLEHLNVPVVGYSLPAEKDSLFDRTERTGAIPEKFADIRDYDSLDKFIDQHKPSTIIHMAAQPLVLKSYEKPRETFDVNVMGTVNILDIAFKKEFVKAIIVVTTDKVYRNDNSGGAFVETDALEGKDPYSASKVGAEAVVAAWQQIARVSGGPSIVSVRAGNVIGGGDFAENRIIPDLIRSVMFGKPIEIRNPNSTRPWQHVLDPLAGYLASADYVLAGGAENSFNFSPNSKNFSVIEVVKIARSIFHKINIVSPTEESPKRIEAEKLDIDSTRSRSVLNWVPLFTQEAAIRETFHWWQSFMTYEESALEICNREISTFLKSTNISSITQEQQ